MYKGLISVWTYLPDDNRLSAKYYQILFQIFEQEISGFAMIQGKQDYVLLRPGDMRKQEISFVLSLSLYFNSTLLVQLTRVIRVSSVNTKSRSSMSSSGNVFALFRFLSYIWTLCMFCVQTDYHSNAINFRKKKNRSRILHVLIWFIQVVRSKFIFAPSTKKIYNSRCLIPSFYV